MSHAATAWAWQVSLPAGPKIVLLHLADRASTRGLTCFPSYRDIAGRCGMSEDTVRRHIRALLDAGIVTLTPRPGTSHLYQLVIHTPPQNAGRCGPTTDKPAPPVDNTPPQIAGGVIHTPPQKTPRGGMKLPPHPPAKTGGESVINREPNPRRAGTHRSAAAELADELTELERAYLESGGDTATPAEARSVRSALRAMLTSPDRPDWPTLILAAQSAAPTPIDPDHVEAWLAQRKSTYRDRKRPARGILAR